MSSQLVRNLCGEKARKMGEKGREIKMRDEGFPVTQRRRIKDKAKRSTNRVLPSATSGESTSEFLFRIFFSSLGNARFLFRRFALRFFRRCIFRFRFRSDENRPPILELAAKVHSQRALGSVGCAALPASVRLQVRVGAVHVELEGVGPVVTSEGGTWEGHKRNKIETTWRQNRDKIKTFEALHT